MDKDKDKYKNSPAEIFKLRMQFKAQVNQLRKTYEQIVIQKPTPEKKHYQNKSCLNQLIPEQRSSIIYDVVQKKHYSQSNLAFSPCRSCSLTVRGRKHYGDLSKQPIKNVLKQRSQRKRSSSHMKLLERSKSFNDKNLNSSTVSTGFHIGQRQKQAPQTYRFTKKINSFYHKFNNNLI